MKKILMLAMVLGLLVSGCAMGSTPYWSTNNVPENLRFIPRQDVQIISMNDPQPDPLTYIVLGKIESHVSNFTIFERRGQEALELLKVEGRRVGADAIINIEIGQTHMSSSASGIAIRLK